MSFPEPIDESAHLETRYQDLVATYYYAQADCHKAQAECRRLKEVLEAKQQAISVLVAHYPHPITPELQAQLDLLY